MAFFKLTLAPGIDKQNTEYGAEGGWTDGDNIRFRYGMPEKIGGWTYFNGTADYLVAFACVLMQSIPRNLALEIWKKSVMDSQPKRLSRRSRQQALKLF